MTGPTITPSVGRVIWFCPAKGDLLSKHSDQPLAATIAYVNADGTVNLTVHDHEGGVHARGSVCIADVDQAISVDQNYAFWMPYQRGQAAKVDDLGPRLAALESVVENLVRSMNTPTGTSSPANAGDKPASAG